MTALQSLKQQWYAPNGINGRRTKDQSITIDTLVFLYLKRRIQWRKYNKRPVYIEYGQIARKLHVSYSTIRRSVDRLVAIKVIHRYKGPHKINFAQHSLKRRNFYLLGCG